MATLISIGNSEGERRCDAKCYNARSPRSECVCGGLNHGNGLRAAQESTRRFPQDLLNQALEPAPQQLVLHDPFFEPPSSAPAPRQGQSQRLTHQPPPTPSQRLTLEQPQVRILLRELDHGPLEAQEPPRKIQRRREVAQRARARRLPTVLLPHNPRPSRPTEERQLGLRQSPQPPDEAQDGPERSRYEAAPLRAHRFVIAVRHPARKSLPSPRFAPEPCRTKRFLFPDPSTRNYSHLPPRKPLLPRPSTPRSALVPPAPFSRPPRPRRTAGGV